MTPSQEKALMAQAQRAADLRKTADHADAMLRSWARRRKDHVGTVRVGLSDQSPGHWWVHVDLTSVDVEKELLPIMRRVRDRARADLAALEMPA